MTADERRLVKSSWIKLSAYYQVQLQDHVFEMYAEDVSDLPCSLVIDAMHSYRRNPKNFRVPLPAMIRDLVSPEIDDETLALDAASRTVGAVAKFGWAQPREARDYVGELGWLVVERCGGWLYICENLGRALNPGTFQAQFRETVKAQAKLGRAGRLNAPPALPQSNKQNGVKILELVESLVKTIPEEGAGDDP